MYETFTDLNGEPGLTYHYINPTDLYGSNSEVDMPAFTAELDFDVHVCGTVRDKAEMIESSDAPEYVLGYAILIVFYVPDLVEHEQQNGLPSGPSHDIGLVLGPFLTTPEDLIDHSLRANPTHYSFRYDIKVGEDQIAKNLYEPELSFGELLQFGSRIRPIQVGEVVAWPKLDKPPLETTPLGRNLTSGDRIEITVDGFGTLIARIG